MTTTDLANVDPDRHVLAQEWHGGQSTTLYAIASTGALTLGTIRPTTFEDGTWRHMTDDEWTADLRQRLWVELADPAQHDAGMNAEDGRVARAWRDELWSMIEE